MRLAATAITAALNASAMPATPKDAAQFLLQAQFNATDADIASVQSKGYASYLNEQITAPDSHTGVDWFTARGYDEINNLTRYYDTAYPGDHMVWTQHMTSPECARKRMALALS